MYVRPKHQAERTAHGPAVQAVQLRRLGWRPKYIEWLIAQFATPIAIKAASGFRAVTVR